MVQPKYNPEEALNRVKLMMNYDLSKTSVENIKIIQEQVTKPTDVKRGKERLLKQPLKDDSVNILNCRKQIDDLFDAWTNRNSSTPQVKAGVPQTRDIVQACYDQHKGKFGLGRNADNKLTILSGRNINVGGPLRNGSTAMYRIEGN